MRRFNSRAELPGCCISTLLITLLCALHAQLWATSDVYQVVHGWPQLPEGFAFGQVSGVAVDSHNHVFVFHRGDRPILRLDGSSGEVLGRWHVRHPSRVEGGQRRQCPGHRCRPHHQVLKFSHDGELLMSVGARAFGGSRWEKHFNGPTDVAVAPTPHSAALDAQGPGLRGRPWSMLTSRSMNGRDNSPYSDPSKNNQQT